MTTTEERPTSKKISQDDPTSGVEIVSFFLNGDFKARPCISFASTGEGITVQDGTGRIWFDSANRLTQSGHPVFVNVSDEPDGYATDVLVHDNLCSDWVLEEAIRALTAVKEGRAAMRAAGSGSS